MVALDTIFLLCLVVRPSSSSLFFAAAAAFFPLPLGSLRFLSLGLRSPFSLDNKKYTVESTMHKN